MIGSCIGILRRRWLNRDIGVGGTMETCLVNVWRPVGSWVVIFVAKNGRMSGADRQLVVWHEALGIPHSQN